MKNIIKIIVFVILAYAMIIIITYIKRPKSIDIQNIMGLYGEKQNTIDAIYYGGSAAFVYWEAIEAYDNYGITSYSFATNTIQPELYKLLIKESLKYQDPDVLIIDARAFQYREKDQPPIMPAYRNALTGLRFSLEKVKFVKEYVKENIGEDENELSYIFDIIMYHNNDEVDYNMSYQMLKNEFVSKYKGFYFVPAALAMKRMDTNTKEKKEVAKETTEILDDLLNYLKKIDKKVLFIVSPYIETKEEKKMFNYIEEKITSSGFDFIDANDYDKEMNINYMEDFYNYNHVNILGADKYTEFLSKYLIENYNLKDRRNDNKYNSWEKQIKDWKNDSKATKDIIKNIINQEGYEDNIYVKE